MSEFRAMQAKTNLQSSPGMLPYSPTRLDWLELDLQANYREADDSDPEKYHTLDFVAKPPDTIVVSFSIPIKPQPRQSTKWSNMAGPCPSEASPLTAGQAGRKLRSRRN